MDYRIVEVQAVGEADCVRLVPSRACRVQFRLRDIPLIVVEAPDAVGGLIELVLRPRGAVINDVVSSMTTRFIDMSDTKDFTERQVMEFDYPILFRQ